MGRARQPRRETSAGGIVFRCTEAGVRFLLILDRHGNWGFPKGHIEGRERPEQAARREVTEETGLGALDPVGPLGAIQWWFQFRGDRIHKRCHYFLYRAGAEQATPQEEEGIVECRWCAPEAALKLLSHRNSRNLFGKALDLAQTECLDGASG